MPRRQSSDKTFRSVSVPGHIPRAPRFRKLLPVTPSDLFALSNRQLVEVAILVRAEADRRVCQLPLVEGAA